jgi:hypothetical protein
MINMLISPEERTFPMGANGCEPVFRTSGTIAPQPRLDARNHPNPWFRATQAAVDDVLPSEQHLLGLLEACGPMDAPNLALASHGELLPVLATLRRLRVHDLVAFRRPHWRLAPRVVRWLTHSQPLGAGLRAPASKGLELEAAP